MNPTNKLAYKRHKYSGPRKSRKKVQAAFKRHHQSSFLYRVEAWRTKKEKVVEETANCPVVFSPHTTEDPLQLSNVSTAEATPKIYSSEQTSNADSVFETSTSEHLSDIVDIEDVHCNNEQTTNADSVLETSTSEHLSDVVNIEDVHCNNEQPSQIHFVNKTRDTLPPGPSSGKDKEEDDHNSNPPLKIVKRSSRRKIAKKTEIPNSHELPLKETPVVQPSSSAQPPSFHIVFQDDQEVDLDADVIKYGEPKRARRNSTKNGPCGGAKASSPKPELLHYNGCINKGSDIGDSEDDLLQSTYERSATAEPAREIDLTQFQAAVLKKEDEVNDKAIRKIVSKNCSSTFIWNTDTLMFQGRRETFSSKPGPTLKLTKQTKPIEIFYEMFDNDFIELLCIATNRKAEDMIALSRKQNKFTTQSRFYQWVPIDRDEMITFLAIIILQGLYRLQNDKAYFVFNGFGTTPYFAKIMSYDRFTLLKDCLCFENNHDIQDTTRLGKIKPVIDYLNLKFSGLYMPSQEIVIDETLLKCNGRLSFAQKVSSRAARTGVKTYELCESLTGYLWKFYVDAGKDKSTGLDEAHINDDLDEDDTNGELDKEETIIDQFAKDVEAVDIIPSENEDCSIKIVYNLIEPLLHRGHTLIMDNFYNSPLLLRHLKKHKTDCYGTLRLSRKFVPDSVKKLTKKNLRQGEAIGTHCSDLGIMVWRDANIVSMISTYHNFQTRSLETTNKMGYKPIIVDDYKKCMATLHKKDQFQSPQPMNRVRCRGWYKTLFYRLYNAGIFNCFVIYSSFQTGITHRNFRVALAEDLVRIHRQICIIRESRSLNINPEVPSSNMTGDVKTLDKRRNIKARPTVEGNHFPIRTGSYHTRCRLCPKKTRTVWKCEECNVNLCILGCFKAFHKS